LASGSQAIAHSFFSVDRLLAISVFCAKSGEGPINSCIQKRLPEKNRLRFREERILPKLPLSRILHGGNETLE
jgi:hypothetical protein